MRAKLVLTGTLLIFAVASAQTTLPSGWKISPAGKQIALDTFPMSGVVTPDGKYMLVMTAGDHPPAISVIDISSAKELSHTPVPDAWLGLTLNKSGDKLYVGGGSRAAVFEFAFANGALTAGRTFNVVPEKDRTPQDFVGDVRFAPDGHLLYVADVHRDAVIVINPQSGVVLSRVKTGRRPYRILFHPSGRSFYVSSWADGSIGQYDVDSGTQLAKFPVALHPTDMLWVDGGMEGQPEVKARLFVTGANTNNVYVLAASETGDLTNLQTVSLALTQRQPLGMTPSALALSADRKAVYAACSDANAVAVIGIDGELTRVRGFVPAGWYPTVVSSLADGQLAILNGRGNSLQIVPAADDAALSHYSDEVAANALYKDDLMEMTVAPPGNPVRADGPVKHVVYVVRDGGATAGAPAPNREKLAKDYVTLDHFVSLAENKAEGVNWATAAIANDYTERLAQNSEAGRRRIYDYEGQDPANRPPAGYIWNALSQVGLKIRNYGFQVHNRAKATAEGEQIDRVYDPALAASTDMEYRGADPAYSDIDRAKEFASEVIDYNEVGDMPQLLMVRIGNDDAALGILADAVAKSKFANEIALFVVDAAGAPETHKASALVISPWTKRGAVDSAPWNQMSVLRTIEIILGLRPLTTFDAAAAPMFSVFAR